MITTDFTFGGKTYPCRVVKDNTGEDLFIGSLDFLDALQPISAEKGNGGFASKEAEEIYDEIFYFTDTENLKLEDDGLVALLKEDNPDWFD